MCFLWSERNSELSGGSAARFYILDVSSEFLFASFVRGKYFLLYPNDGNGLSKCRLVNTRKHYDVQAHRICIKVQFVNSKVIRSKKQLWLLKQWKI